MPVPQRHHTIVLALVLPVLCAALEPTTAHGQRSRSARTTATNESSPRLYRSANFHVMTDLPREQARDLLQRLETMHRLLTAYWGRRNPRTIEMFVVNDLANWPDERLQQMDPQGLASIRSGGGLTITQVISSGKRFASKAVVYAVADHGTPQHEAVHAYCGHAFGSAGPVWYAEGMAEVGKYWRENDKSVTANEYVIRYLRESPIRPLNDIVNNPLETTGDSWQNYAWRWALCHLLGFNENYTRRFKPLGLALLTGNNVNFWQVYGTQAQEIEFEYRQFIKNLEPGYRCDLCSWDWKTRFRGPSGSRPIVSRIRADRGWQASRLRVKKGQTYRYSCDGKWELAKDAPPVTADGDDQGQGRLFGVYFEDYELSEPFPLGAEGTFTATQDGDLFLRCGDAWGEIADNSGTIKVELTLEKTPATASPPEPQSP